MSGNEMASTPILTVLEESRVSPSPAILAERSLPLTFLDVIWLLFPPVQTLFFYELQISKTQFIEDIIPKLKTSFSITLQHFFPLAGKLVVFPTPTRTPEIRYVEGDSVSVRFAECSLDFKNLTGNHPRGCDQFDHLIPLLGATEKMADYVTIPVFSVQVTFFPNHGFSIGMTNHHGLGDANTRFHFLKAWTSIAQSGSDELFLADGTLPCFDRLINHPKLNEIYLKYAKVETYNGEHQPPSHSDDDVRVTVILTRTVLNRLKKVVSTQVPTLAYVSSFTVACAFIWSCIAKSRNDEVELFSFAVNCRARMDPPIPAAYFGNCLGGCFVAAKTLDITGSEGFVTAAKIIGENLHKMLTDKDGFIKDYVPDLTKAMSNLNSMPTTKIGITGTSKFKFYDLDFGWGKPKKIEMISVGRGSMSLNGSKESSDDLEIGVCLSASEMEIFLRTFNDGLEAYI